MELNSIKLVQTTNIDSCDAIVLIGSQENLPNGVGEDLNELFLDFLKKEQDSIELKELNSTRLLFKDKKNGEEIRKYGAKAWSSIGKTAKNVHIYGTPENAFWFIEGLLLASYSFSKYLTKKPEHTLNIVQSGELNQGQLDELNSISKVVSWSRDMVNEPVSYLNAEVFAMEMKNMASETGVKTTILEKTQIESLKMGGLLSVNQGSIDPPTFTILEYKPENAKNKKPVVFVGKGVVYDTGGLSLKPTPNSMDLMKSDMGGAACMAGAIFLCAKEKLPVHIICLIPATDNRPGLNATAPGDIVTMYNGKTVEVLNTDAEGRMILADALSYSKKYDPELVIDAATLTGAAHRAIGDKATIVMGNASDDKFEQLEKAGTLTHERTVKFPFWDDYLEEMKSPIADLKNLGGPTAGMITAGKFLEQFVSAPYIHMDIAGPAWSDKSKGYWTVGGTGVGVRLLYEFIKNYS